MFMFAGTSVWVTEIFLMFARRIRASHWYAYLYQYSHLTVPAAACLVLGILQYVTTYSLLPTTVQVTPTLSFHFSSSSEQHPHSQFISFDR
jgi:hypothetical protein